MNNNIKKLADQCWKVVGDWSDGGSHVFDYEKFAELIIRECLQLCDNNIDDIVSGAICTRNDIKEHFGVN
jgi:hypothetical protein